MSEGVPDLDGVAAVAHRAVVTLLNGQRVVDI
jgi:hypothetical protein